jgi:hypothetical protein
MASAWALLGEFPGLAALAGAALLVAGVLIAQGTLRPRHPAPAAPRGPDGADGTDGPRAAVTARTLRAGLT